MAILFMLLSVTVGIDLSHIEKNGGSSPTCPACTFHLASVADAVTVCLVLPEPALNGTVVSSEIAEHEFFSTALLAARSPPLASL